MDTKLFWKSKLFWTPLIGFLVTTLTAVIPMEYKEIIMAGEGLIIAILTIVFRWNTEQKLGWR